MTRFEIRYSPEAKESIQNLPDKKLKNITERVMINISENPFKGTKLLGKLAGLYSARITRRYRVIYHIDTSNKTVSVVDVVHRKDSYK